LFPYLSNNHDEAVYLLQANAIEHGHLFPRAGAQPEAFLPWLSAQDGHVFIPKYAPVFPTMLAIGKWVFTTERMSIALIAAGIIVMTYLLASEILDNGRHAVLASVFMLCSPLFILQSATFLPYAASLLLLSTFAFALLRGLRTGRGGWLALSGLALGLAFFARPYDALLFALPLAAYVVVRSRQQVRELAQHIGWIALGAVPPAVAMAAFDYAATGSPFQSPFSLIDSRDTIGFGERSMDPNNPGLRYTPGLGWTGMSRHMMLTMFWCFGGLVLVGCAVYFLARKRWRGHAAWFGAIAIVFPIGYLFFWGTYGAAVWGAPWYLGPYYYMPIFAPIVVLGAGGFVEFVREYRKIAAWALAGMVVLSVFVTTQAMIENWGFTQDDRRLNTALDDTELDNALVFLPAFYGERVLHPFATARNNWNATGDVLYAVDRGDDDNAAVVADYPARTPYKVRIRGNYRDSPRDPNLTTTLEPLEVLRARRLAISVRFRSPQTDPVLAVTVALNGRTDTYVIDRSARRGDALRLDLRVGPGATTVTGGRVVEHTRGPAAAVGELQIQIGSARNALLPPQAFYFRRIGTVQRGDEMVLLLPGDEMNGFLSPEPVTIKAA
jgi:hypothetical protein